MVIILQKYHVVVVCYQDSHYRELREFVGKLLNVTDKRYIITVYTCVKWEELPANSYHYIHYIPIPLRDDIVLTYYDADVIFFKHIYDLYTQHGRSFSQLGVISLVRPVPTKQIPNTEKLFSNIIRSASSLMYDFYDAQFNSRTITEFPVVVQEVLLIPHTKSGKVIKEIVEPSTVISLHAKMIASRNTPGFFERVLKYLSPSDVSCLWHPLFLGNAQRFNEI